MHAKVSGLTFNVGLKTDDKSLTTDLFGEHISAFDLEFFEGISAAYKGILKIYGDKEAPVDKLSAMIGKALYIKVSIKDDLAGNGQNLTVSEYTFDRNINASIQSIVFEGKAFEITQPATSDKSETKKVDIFEYHIYFASCLDILVKSSISYTDDYIGNLEDKLLNIFNNPKKLVFGQEYKTKKDELVLDAQMLDEKNLADSLPDTLKMQFANVPPMAVVNRLLLGYGLNYNIVHTSNNKPILYLTRGYGVNKKRSVTSKYFPDKSDDLLNYDANAVILCDMKDNGTPRLSEVRYRAVNKQQAADKYSNCLDNLFIFAAKGTESASAREIEARTQSIKYISGKINRERCIYSIKASHLIFTPGTVVKVKNYLSKEIKLIIDDAKMHLTCELNSFFGNSHNPDPCLEVDISAYELKESNDPGTFMSFDEIGVLEGVSTANPASMKYFFPTNPVADAISSGSSDVSILEAIVSDGEGNILGLWDETSKEPRIGSICICEGDDTQNPSKFYALPINSVTPLTATVTSTVPGARTFNFPRIGDRVLLVRTGNKYYYLATAAKDSSIAVSSQGIDNRDAQVSALNLLDVSGAGHRVHVWNSKDPSKNVGIKVFGDTDKVSSIKLLKNSSVREIIKSAIADGTVGNYVYRVDTELNSSQATKLFYDTWQESLDAKYLNGEVDRYKYKAPEGEDLTKTENANNKNKTPAGFTLAQRCVKIKNDYKLVCSSLDKIGAELDDLKAQKKSLEKDLLRENESIREDNEWTDPDAMEDLKEISQDIGDIIKLIEDKKTAEKKKKAEKEECVKYMYSLADKFLDDIGAPLDVQSDISDVLKIDHDGNIEISSKGTVTINAKKINLQSSGGTTLSGNGGIKMENTQQIKMGVRGCSFTIFPGTMSFMATPFACGALGSFGSFVTFDSYNGIKLNSTSIKAVAKFDASIADSLGGKIGVSKGAASVKGNGVTVAANSLHDQLMALIRFDAQLGLEFIKTMVAVTDSKNYMATRNIIDGVVYPLADKMYSNFATNGDGKLINFKKKVSEHFANQAEIKKQFVTNYKNTNQNQEPSKKQIDEATKLDTKTKWNFVASFCDGLCDCIDFIVDVLSMLEQAWMAADRLRNYKDQDDINVFDRTGWVGKNHMEDIRYIGCSVKYILNSIAANALYLANSDSALVKAPAIKLGGGEITQSAYKLQLVTLGTVTANSAVMGTPESTVTLGIDETKDASGNVLSQTAKFTAEIPKK